MVRIDAVSYSAEGVFEEADVTVGRCRELVEKYTVTWIDVVDVDNRTRQELETLFSLHPLSLEDASRTDIPPKVEPYDDVLFIVQRTINWAEEIETAQLSVFLAKRYLMTLHDRVLPQLEDVKVRIRKKDPKVLKSGPDFLCYLCLDIIVDSYFPHLDRLDDIIEGMEEVMVTDASKVSIERVHSVRTDLLRLRNALRPQRDSFSQLTRIEAPFFKKETRNYLRDVYDHVVRSLDTLDAQREIVTSLMEVQATLVSNQLNVVLKVLTVVFTATIPLSLVTSFFGMNVAFFGLENTSFGFLAALALMLFLTLITLGWVRYKKWI